MCWGVVWGKRGGLGGWVLLILGGLGIEYFRFALGGF